MRIGRRVAFDVGMARIGVAVSDPHGILASPRQFVLRLPDLSETIISMMDSVREDEPIEYYVGLPTNLRNEATASTEDSLAVAQALQIVCTQAVRLVDERLTTRIASGVMSGTGKSTRQQRGSIDSASAAVILETAMQFERSNGIAPGILIGDYESGN